MSIFRSRHAQPARRTSRAWKVYDVEITGPDGRYHKFQAEAKSREGARQVAYQRFGRHIRLRSVRKQ